MPWSADQTAVAAQVFEIGGAEPLHLVRLLAVGADDADAGERFLDHGAEVGELLLDRLEPAVDLLAEVANADRDERQRREGDERQPGVDRQHQDDRHDERENGAGRIHDRRPDHHAHRVEVVGGARHQVAGAPRLVILQRHLAAGARRTRSAGRIRCRARRQSGSAASGIGTRRRRTRSRGAARRTAPSLARVTPVFRSSIAYLSTHGDEQLDRGGDDDARRARAT